MRSVYEAAGGGEGLLRLAEAWHARVMADPLRQVRPCDHLPGSRG